MVQRAECHFRSSVFVRIIFIYAIVLIAFFGISAAADAYPITVSVRYEGKIIEIEIDSTAIVFDLKQLLYKETHVSPNKQRLAFNGRELDNDFKYLSNYHITNHSELVMVERLFPGSEQTEPGRLSSFRLCDNCILPATGFSSLHPAVLAEQPNDLRYMSVRMRLMIPSLEVDSKLVSVPQNGNSWAVEWLDDRSGVLEGSALPGEGLSVVAAHNTLNDTEYGPFALLNTLGVNDLIVVSGGENDLRTFRVFANELLAPDDLEQMASLAEREANTLVLITCENESADGGYLNRRVVFAKPVF
ncbi:MAG: sortase [Anaerolineaceae bacterium]|nr:sortase [Anaerolineaceae bacterium]